MGPASLSVVVGFKNWGAERLEVSARSLIRSFGSLDAELIISDYGSDDSAVAKEVAAAVGATVCRTVADPVWSRSRALNAGFAQARGQLLISTDADMVFSPEAIQTICRWWEHSPGSAYFLQCRDLPRDVTARLLGGADIESSELERASRLRPRWGMGGMMAISRTQFAAMRGFDERLHTYGREDMDFALRARRAGYRNIWIEAPEARMYHMWHEPALATPAASDSLRDAVARNRRLVDEDNTWVRNLGQWRYPLQDKNPLIRVVLLNAYSGDSTEQTLRSLQVQTVVDWEALVVIDPIDGALEQEIGQFDDKRIRTSKTAIHPLSDGAVASILDSSADFIMFLDGSCILPPGFLETQLSSFTEDVKGVRANQVDLRALGKPETGVDLRDDSARCLGAVFHGPFARQIARHAERHFQFSQLALAIESLGRTVVNNHDGVFFRVAGRPDLTPNEEETPLEGLEAYLPYLPDGYIKRVLNIEESHDSLELATFEGSLYGTQLKRDGERVKIAYQIVNATYRDMAWLRTKGFGFSVHASVERDERVAGMSRTFLKEAVQIASENHAAQARAVVVVDGEALTDMQSGLGTTVSEHNTGPLGELVTVALVVFSESHLQEALVSLGERVRMVLNPHTDGDRIAD